jgi:transposase
MNAMSVTQFAKRFGVSPATAYRIVASGQIDLVDRKATGNRPRIGITDAAYTKFLAKREIHRSAA